MYKRQVREGAEGAYLVKREYERLLEEGEKDVMISSICPSVVRLVKIHYPELMDSLLSVLSPMQAHGKYLKEQNRECTLVYISPCISPIAELNEQINDVSYVCLLYTSRCV